MNGRAYTRLLYISLTGDLPSSHWISQWKPIYTTDAMASKDSKRSKDLRGFHSSSQEDGPSVSEMRECKLYRIGKPWDEHRFELRTGSHPRYGDCYSVTVLDNTLNINRWDGDLHHRLLPWICTSVPEDPNRQWPPSRDEAELLSSAMFLDSSDQRMDTEQIMEQGFDTRKLESVKILPQSPVFADLSDRSGETAVDLEATLLQLGKSFRSRPLHRIVLEDVNMVPTIATGDRFSIPVVAEYLFTSAPTPSSKDLESGATVPQFPLRDEAYEIEDVVSKDKSESDMRRKYLPDDHARQYGFTGGNITTATDEIQGIHRQEFKDVMNTADTSVKGKERYLASFFYLPQHIVVSTQGSDVGKASLTIEYIGEHLFQRDDEPTSMSVQPLRSRAKFSFDRFSHPDGSGEEEMPSFTHAQANPMTRDNFFVYPPPDNPIHRTWVDPSYPRTTASVKTAEYVKTLGTEYTSLPLHHVEVSKAMLPLEKIPCTNRMQMPANLKYVFKLPTESHLSEGENSDQEVLSLSDDYETSLEEALPPSYDTVVGQGLSVGHTSTPPVRRPSRRERILAKLLCTEIEDGEEDI